MAVFARSFGVDALAEWDAKNPGNAVRALFTRWCLPGEKAAGSASLRLGLRDGYLNFYIKGQSVAKLSCGTRGPKLSLHNAYVSGRRKTREGDGLPPEQGYRDYDAAALADPATSALVADWIATAETYASAEKRFVDDLIAANPGVIDLEMGLPASNLTASERVAPRMDLVVAQRADGGPLSICFWEAKCANNQEVRASGDSPPRVLEQVAKYVAWMAEPGRIEQVQQAYRTTASKLLDLHRLFRNNDPSDLQCLAIWQALTEIEAPAVAVEPGIVIGNYWPEGHTELVASGRMAQCAVSFARNGHRDKLERAGVRVHEVGPDHSGPALPIVSVAKVPA